MRDLDWADVEDDAQRMNDLLQELDYEAGYTAGELSGAAARYYDAPTGRWYDPDRSAFKEGFSDGFCAGYWIQAREEATDG